jgi:carbamate kinase
VPRVYPRVVAALSASALSERGWPSLAEDPAAAAARAGRSISYVADHHSMIVTHCLPERTAALLQQSIERLLDEPVLSMDVLDAATIDRFVAQRFVVLCAVGTLESCHDDVAADLAIALDADVLLFLTGEPVVWEKTGRGEPRGLKTASSASLDDLSVDGDVVLTLDAARRFVQATGRLAAIGAIDHAEAMVAGVGGTQIRDDDSPLRFYGDDTRSP